jgi:uncharacterized protein (TIGR02757 family)
MNDLTPHEIYELLEQKYDEFNRPLYIDSDPIQIPHRFSKPEDIEIAGFLTATIAWGNRKSIITNASRLMAMMDNSPHDFVCNVGDEELALLHRFVHRTFNGDDCMFAIRSLKNIYLNHGGLHTVFVEGFAKSQSMQECLIHTRTKLLETPLLKGRDKHIANAAKNSSCKRINMYLRWMVRNDNRQVDFGLWNDIPMSALLIPLDVHVGNVARKLGLLQRNQDDWKSVEILTQQLKAFCPHDPVKYDYSLFGLGVFERF